MVVFLRFGFGCADMFRWWDLGTGHFVLKHFVALRHYESHVYMVISLSLGSYGFCLGGSIMTQFMLPKKFKLLFVD